MARKRKGASLPRTNILQSGASQELVHLELKTVLVQALSDCTSHAMERTHAMGSGDVHWAQVAGTRVAYVNRQ